MDLWVKRTHLRQARASLRRGLPSIIVNPQPRVSSSLWYGFPRNPCEYAAKAYWLMWQNLDPNPWLGKKDLESIDDLLTLAFLQAHLDEIEDITWQVETLYAAKFKDSDLYYAFLEARRLRKKLSSEILKLAAKLEQTAV